MPVLDQIVLALLVVLGAGVVAALWSGRRMSRRLRRRLDRLERALRLEQAHARRLAEHVLVPEMRAAGQGRPGPRFEPELASQHGEDAFLWDLFEGKGEGFFIEVGAYDGYWMSATYALEAAGWRGLLVEALPERFEQCRARRPGSRVVHTAVSKRGSAGTATFQAIEGGTNVGTDMASGLAPQEEQRRLISRTRASVRSITVPLTTLADLLAAHAGPIDVALIDVEGAEMDVLDGLEVEKTRPRVLVVEDLSLGKDRAVPEFVGARGYEEVARLGHNRFYVTSGEPRLCARARRLAGPVAVHPAGAAPVPET